MKVQDVPIMVYIEMSSLSSVMIAGSPLPHHVRSKIINQRFGTYIQGLFQDFASEGANAKFQNSRGGGQIQSQGGATPY